MSSNQDTFADLGMPHRLALESFDLYPATFSMQYILYKSSEEFGGYGQFDGRLTSLHTATAVPEPAPVALFATGVALLFAHRRRFVERR